MTKQIQRYYQTNVEESVAEANYSAEQMKQALSEFGYTHFPTNGITDKGFRTLMERVSEIDEQEANLRPTKRKDLSSKVFEPKMKVARKKKERSGGYLSVVGKDLGKVGRGIGSFISGPFMVPTVIMKCSDSGLSGAIVGNFLSIAIYYPSEFSVGNPKRGLIVLGAHLGLNLLSGIYEYVRHVKERVREETQKVSHIEHQ